MIWPQILTGDAYAVLKTLADESAHMCVTSPPYFQLRDYEVDGQIGLEQTPEEFVARLVEVFGEVRRVLRQDGTLWLNIGDTYAGSGRGGYPGGLSGLDGSVQGQDNSRKARAASKAAFYGLEKRGWTPPPDGYKRKDLIGIPWMLAFALRADGWYLRQEIIWSKRNPMPESIGDRPTRSHEQLFLLSKQPIYYYDADAIMEPASRNTHARVAQDVARQHGSERANGGARADRPMKAVIKAPKTLTNAIGSRNNSSFNDAISVEVVKKRNKRSVWDVTTQPSDEAHFATFPPKLIEPCILAGCPVDGTVLDPFAGTGTTGIVAQRLGRRSILIDLNPGYAAIADRRCRNGNVGFGFVDQRKEEA